MEFTELKMDFQIPRAKLGNYFHANILMPNDALTPFIFPAELYSEDFYLQKMTYDNVKMEYSFADYLLLNNTYKNADNYFEEYSFATKLDVAVYRIKAGEYYSKSLINAKVISGTFKKYSNILDYHNSDIFDFDNSEIIQPL